MSRVTSIAVLLGLAVAVPTGARADESVWAGNGSGTWSTASSWVGSHIPGSSDNVSLKGWEPLLRTSWTISASNTNGGNPTTNAKDGHLATYWWSGAAMSTSMWVQIDLGSTQTFGGLDLAENLNGTDYPLGYDIYVSSNGSSWGSPVFSNNAGSTYDQNQFSDQTARYIKIQINTNASSNWWAISELTVWGTAGDTQLSTGGMTASSSTSYVSGSNGPAAKAIDFDRTTLFQTGAVQASGMWFNLNMGTTQTISAITMDSYLSPGDYANSYKIDYSTTSTCSGGTGTYNSLVGTTSGTTEFIQVTFTPKAVRCVRVTLMANSGSNWWTMSEFHVFGVPSTCTMPATTTIGSLNITNAVTFVQGSGNALTINGDFNQSAGTFTGSNSAVNVSGNLNLSGGTFTSTSDLLTVDAFNKTGGTFTHNSGRLMLSASSDQTFATNDATFNNLIINDGLVGYWKLDDGTTPIVDSSGYAQNGTLSNTPTWGGALPALNFTDSNAMTLNGTNQYARVSRTTALEPTAVTVSAWIKRSGNQTQFAKVLTKPYNNEATLPYATYELQMNNGGSDSSVVSFSIGTAGPSSAVLNSTSGSVPDGTWTHVVAVYNPSGSAPQKRLYINGVSNATATLSTALLYDTSSHGDLYIGTAGAGIQYFKGSIDDVRIYNRALTDQEIYSLYAGNQPGTSLCTQTMTGSPTIANDLTLATGTLASGSNNFTVGGSWNNYGGIFTGTGTVTMNSTGSEVIRSAGQPFKNLTLNGSGATWTLEDWLKVTSTLTMTNGALAAGSNAIHVGNISKTSGTLTAGTGTVVLDSTSNVTESSGFSFNNLRIEAPDESGLVGYWKFDEGQGTVIHDASGTGNDGTLTSTSWTDSTPPAIDFDNHAGVTFNGSTSYGVLGTTSLPANNASQSISFWFNSGTNAGGTGNDMVTLWNGGSSSVTSVGIVGAGLLGVWKWGPITLVSTSAPSTGAWHHVVYTYKSTGTVNTLYVDGVSVSTSTTAPNSATPTAAEIGGFNGSNLYTGSIDDLRIYNVTLTATQVANLYAGGYSGVGSNTVVTLGANLTVNKTLAIDDGTLDTSTFTVNAAATDSTQTATVNGTLKVGSNTATFNGGLTIGKLGSVTENTAGGKVALGTRGVVEFDEPSGGAVGFPTAAFNWNTFAFWREYVTYSSYVGASTADTVLAMTADGGTKYSWPLPSAHGFLVGTPRWNTEGTSPGTQYIYLITTTGYVYKVLDDGTQLATVSGWPYHNGASATATSPLANDSSNLYWSGFAGDGTTPKIFSLTLAGVLNGTGLTIASNVTAAPALATVSATPYVFFAIASHVYQETLTLGTQITSTQPTTAVNGRVTVYNNIIYFPENNGKVWALNASASAPTTAWSYQDATGAVVSNIYVDVTANRTCFGDAAGYIYVLNSAGAALTGFPWQISSSDVFSIAPLSRNGVLLIGTAAGKVYEIDETNGTTRALTHTYTLPGGAAVSSISFNSSANAGNGAYTVGTSDGKLYYINAGTDPTSGNP